MSINEIWADSKGDSAMGESMLDVSFCLVKNIDSWLISSSSSLESKILLSSGYLYSL